MPPTHFTDPDQELKATRARPSSPPSPLIGVLIICGIFALVIAVLILFDVHSVRPR